jgi:hypothetical protein
MAGEVAGRITPLPPGMSDERRVSAGQERSLNLVTGFPAGGRSNMLSS